MLIKYDRLPVRMIHDDVVESYKIIEENLGNKDLKVFAYPYGAYTKETSKVFLEPLSRIELLTYGLRIRCSTN